jgi:hypothetical protein
MSDLEICLVTFSMLFLFAILLKELHSRSELTGGDVLAILVFSIMFGIVVTPIILTIFLFELMAVLFNKGFSKL